MRIILIYLKVFSDIVNFSCSMILFQQISIGFNFFYHFMDLRKVLSHKVLMHILSIKIIICSFFEKEMEGLQNIEYFKCYGIRLSPSGGFFFGLLCHCEPAMCDRREPYPRMRASTKWCDTWEGWAIQCSRHSEALPKNPGAWILRDARGWGGRKDFDFAFFRRWI